MLLENERQQVAEYGRRMQAAGLCPGTSGNLSVCDRERGLFAVSPSGMAYEEIRPEDVTVLDFAGNVADGTRKPSSEWALHAAFYREKQNACAVIHTHALYCTTFAVLRQPLRAVHYCIAPALPAYDPERITESIVPVAPYQTFGTGELAEAAVRTCGEGNAVLLSNHGIVVCGKSIKAAFSLMQDLEYLAQLQYQAQGGAYVLSDDQMQEAKKRFTTYGQKPGGSSGY
ncbi:MAG: class II aldolase/adducin family protein [Lachnospiraceae bacterium]|nr:class II aldolase/adducin family protein [Lachnospiraceae bacterium]